MLDMWAVSFPDLDRVAPAFAVKREACLSKSPPQQLAGEDGTNKLIDSPNPSPHIQLDLDQLRAVIMRLLQIDCAKAC